MKSAFKLPFSNCFFQEFETSLFEYIENNAHDIIDTIENTGEMSKECEEKIRSSVEDCKKRFVK